MPDCFIEGPSGLRNDAKKKLVEKMTASLTQAYKIPDIRIFIREYPGENVAQDGRLQEPIRPVCFINVPILKNVDVKRDLQARIHSALGEAYEGIANVNEAMIFFNQYELENVAWAGSLQSDRPEIVKLIDELNGVTV
jgi:phenylpyruvate tautomerase PptA (4-oxalocrotonate tautomerase family)